MKGGVRTVRIALCDDEKRILDELSKFINSYAQRKNGEDVEIFCFESASALLGELDDGKSFDIFIIDVYIGDEMGTALARSIRKLGIESPIIFATTSLEHAPESFETGTLRYLIKPINAQKLYEALDAAFVCVKKIAERFLKLKTENGAMSVNASHIIYTEAHDHYQYIHLDGGKEIKMRMTVTELFSMLGKYSGFIRVGGAYTINLRYVKNITRTDLLLYNNVVLRIPRGKWAEIKNEFWNFQCDTQED